jgi:cytochrome c oxidase subunit II
MKRSVIRGIFSALLAALGWLTARAGTEPGFWMPVQGSTTAHRVDWLFHFILIISVVFFLLIVFLMTLFVIRYRRRRGVEAQVTATHSTPLELTWSLIPLVLVLLIFYFGFKSYMDMSTPPGNSYEILVTAQKWNWSFTYPNGYVDANLHVPVDTPIRLVLSSEDVIHALYIPAFRVKKDVVPGRYNKIWFRATTPGEYNLFCAEYCGLKHSDMLATVVVHPPGEFEKWLAEAGNFVDKLPPAEAGARLYKARGCMSCHSVDGKAGIGPTFKALYGTAAILKTGEKIPVDENYVRQSILDPGSQVVAGFDPVMPTYKGRIKDKEITVLIEYLKSLK